MSDQLVSANYRSINLPSFLKNTSLMDRVIVFTLSFACFAAKTTFIVKTSLRQLAMTPYMIDDSLILMQIARNLAQGKGFSFNGISPTSGAPLAWPLLTSLNHIVLDKVSAAKLTVIESAVLSTLCSILVFGITLQLYNRVSAYFAFFLSLLSASLFFNSMNGMETYLFAFLGLLCLYLYVSMNDRSSLTHWGLLGSLLGLLNLVRVDGVFAGICVFAYEFFHILRQDDIVRKGRKFMGSPSNKPNRYLSLIPKHVKVTEWKRLILFGSMMALCTLPMLVWNYHAGRSLLATNQTGRYFLAHREYPLTELGLWGYLDKILHNVLELARLYDITLGSFVIALLAMIWVVMRKGNDWQRIAPFLMYFWLFFGLLTCYQWYFPDVHGLRYIVFTSLLLSIIIGSFLAGTCGLLGRHVPPSHTKGNLIVYSLLLMSLITFSYTKYVDLISHLRATRNLDLFAKLEQQRLNELWQPVDWIRANTPEGAIVAGAHHGRLAYFSDRTIVDLAGIIDPEVIDYIKQNDLEPYLKKHHVDYIILHAHSSHHLSQAVDLDSGHYTLVKSFTEVGDWVDWLLYRVTFPSYWVKALPPYGQREVTPQHSLLATLADKIVLVGYDIDREEVRPAQSLTVTLYWQALTKLEQDYSVFLHLRNEADQLVAQRDHQPQDSTYPTSTWHPTEMMKEDLELLIPEDLPPGQYELKAGMYLAQTMERLPVQNDTSGENAVILGKVVVVE